MTATVADRLDAVRAEQMSMSMRLTSYGLTFAYGHSANDRHEGILPLDTRTTSLEEAVRELFFVYPELCYPYQSVKVYYTPQHSVLVPRDLYQSSDVGGWLHGVGLNKGLQALGYPLREEPKVIVGAWSAELYQFLCRTHLQLHFEPYYIALLEARRLESRLGSYDELVLSLRPEGVDCLVLRSGELIFVNSFGWTTLEEQARLGEAVYYSFAIWQSMGLRAEHDAIHVVYPPDHSDTEALGKHLMDELALRIRRSTHATYAPII